MSLSRKLSPSASVSDGIFAVALGNYTKQTGIDLINNPLTIRIKNCDVPNTILDILREQASGFDGLKNGNNAQLLECLMPIKAIIDCFYALSIHHSPSGSACPVFTLAKHIFSGIGLLLFAAAKSNSASHDALLELFECIESLLRAINRLMVQTGTTLTPVMTETVAKIMAELLSVLTLATKQVNEGRLRNYAKELLEQNDVGLVLQRLARLTQEEAQVTFGLILEVIYGIISNMTVVMEDGNALTGDIRQALVSIHRAANEMTRINSDQFQQDLHRWLSPPNPSTNYNISRETHHRGTAAWFTESKTFQQWKMNGSLLWINGKPGSGKSVLCSTVIHNVQLLCKAGLAIVGYFYADFRDRAKHSTRGLLSSLLTQLCIQSESFCEILHSFYLKHNRGLLQPSDGALTSCLKEMLAVPSEGPLYIIVDALDEYPNSHGFPSPREQVLKVVKNLVDLNLPHIHFCITSRPEMDIRTALSPLATHSMCLHEQAGQNKDIATYIEDIVHSDAIMRGWSKEDKRLVIETLAENGGGMFRWAYCQLETLRRCPLQRIRKVLKGLPKTLDETYERTLQGIDEEKWECAYRIFQFLTISARPLRVEELAEVFAIRVDAETTGIPEFEARWRPADAEAAVLSACSSLITIVDVCGEQVVQFSHFSVQEFLTGSRLARSEHLSRYHVLLRSAHTFLAKACLSILLRLTTRIHKGSVKKMFPLVDYAAKHWVGHAHQGEVSSLIDDGMEHLFDEKKPYFVAWVWAYDMDNPSGPHMVHTHPEKPGAGPLYYAALCGFQSMVVRLVNANPQVVNAPGGDSGSPLHVALCKGHLSVALYLLQHRAKANVKDSQHQTPLHIASHQGYTDVIRSLITHDVDLNAEDRENETPMSLASRRGKIEAIQLLLQHGADANHRGSSGQAPLHVASNYGHREVVQLLLDHGANPNAQDQYLQGPLHLASDLGCLAVASVLLEHGADVDARDVRGWTPLHMACSSGKVEAARLLMDHGADIDAEEEDGWTALHLAAYNGRYRVVDLLLQLGADPHTKNKEGNTPIRVISESHNAAQVEAARLLSKKMEKRNRARRRLQRGVSMARSYHIASYHEE